MPTPVDCRSSKFERRQNVGNAWDVFTRSRHHFYNFDLEGVRGLFISVIGKAKHKGNSPPWVPSRPLADERRSEPCPTSRGDHWEPRNLEPSFHQTIGQVDQNTFLVKLLTDADVGRGMAPRPNVEEDRDARRKLRSARLKRAQQELEDQHVAQMEESGRASKRR
ncbi:hypothetical protein V8E54_004311 [Elaphomyces granulatus]